MTSLMSERAQAAAPEPLAFGGGIRRCLGSHLARTRVRAAMREWHRRIPDYRIPEGSGLSCASGLRSVVNLPLTWT
jgi:cytochrome P450